MLEKWLFLIISIIIDLIILFCIIFKNKTFIFR